MKRIYVLPALLVLLVLPLALLCEEELLCQDGPISAEEDALRVALYPLLANVISGNLGDGVFITNFSTGNTISGNVIGTDLSGRRNLGNGGAGVRITINSSDNFIGGPTLQGGNYIAFNKEQGVVVGENASDLSVSNTIYNNSIYSNALPGIDLADDGFTANHPTSPTAGPNDFQNYPILKSFELTATGMKISWALNSVPNAGFALQFFANAVGDPEGKLLIGSANTTTDAAGNASGVVSVGTVPLNTPITATASRIVDEELTDTSEFSFPLVYGVLNPCLPKPCCNGSGRS